MAGGRRHAMTIRVVTIAAVIVAIAISANPAASADSAQNRLSLAGVPLVEVLVEEVQNQDLVRAGLSIEVIQTDVELRLRSAGIPVGSAPSSSYLYVSVTGVQDRTADGRPVGYSAAVSVEFVQGVRLQRNPAVQLSAPTWSKHAVATGETTESIRRMVRDLVDIFANAYLDANPKR